MSSRKVLSPSAMFYRQALKNKQTLDAVTRAFAKLEASASKDTQTLTKIRDVIDLYEAQGIKLKDYPEAWLAVRTAAGFSIEQQGT